MSQILGAAYIGESGVPWNAKHIFGAAGRKSEFKNWERTSFERACFYASIDVLHNILVSFGTECEAFEKK